MIAFKPHLFSAIRLMHALFQMSDFDYIAKVLNAICKEIKDTILNEQVQQAV